MKVYLDNCLPRTLKRYLAGDVQHAVDRQWGDLKNGVLLERVEAEYDVFITVDRAQRQQQEWRKRFADYQMAFIVLRVFSNALPSILPFVGEINETLARIQYGDVAYIGEPKLLRQL